MDAQRFRTSLVSEPLYSKLSNLRWPHTPDEYTLGMRVDVERLRMEIVLSQRAPPPQCDSSPRRAPAVYTGSDGPGTPQAESQSIEREGIFALQASGESFLHVSTSLDQEGTNSLLQPDVGVDDNDVATTLKAQADACKEFAGLPICRQQRETAATEHSKQFDPGG